MHKSQVCDLFCDPAMKEYTYLLELSGSSRFPYLVAELPWEVYERDLRHERTGKSSGKHENWLDVYIYPLTHAVEAAPQVAA
jgi:hypothetical protein